MSTKRTERLDRSIQQNLLALLCLDTEHGAHVATILEPNQFNGLARGIAAAAYSYRIKYSKAPGKRHLPTLIEQLPLQKEELQAARELALEMPRLVKHMNKDFVLSQATTFAIKQNYMVGAEELATELGQDSWDMEKAGGIVHRMAVYQPRQIDGGIRLNDLKAALRFLDKGQTGYKMMIEPFDKKGLRLSPGTLTLYLGSKNSGKSWACTHVGRAGAMQGANVLHVTLEMSQEQVAKRYVQSMLAATTGVTEIVRPVFVLDKEKQRAANWKIKHRKQGIVNLDDARPNQRDDNRNSHKARASIEEDMQRLERYTERIVIKEFPTGTLTVGMLDNYLTFMDQHHNFQPHILLVDYPDLMKLNIGEYRLDLGATIIALRGLAQRRRLALLCPSQINRTGALKTSVRSTHISEDMSKVFTADNVITYSQTPTEQQAHLARLYLNHARDIEVGLEIAIAQSYATGQFVTAAYPMTQGYRGLIEEAPTIGADKKIDGMIV